MTQEYLDITLLYDLSHREPKSLLERFVKLSEECGELAQELLISNKASGTDHKQEGEDGILGEAVDITLVSLSIFFAAGGTPKDLAVIMQRKCEKWQRLQRVIPG